MKKQLKLGLIIATVFVGLILSGCNSKGVKPVVVVSESAPKSICRGAPKADQVYNKDVIFIIVEDEHGIKWIALTPKHYENLSLNIKELQRLSEQRKKIIKFYEKCLEDGKSETKIKEKDTKK